MFIPIATFIMLIPFIAIIVNAMQTFSEEEHRDTANVVDQAREHIETDLHSEIRELRAEIAELKTLLTRPQE